MFAQPNRQGDLQFQHASLDRHGPDEPTTPLLLLGFDLAIGAGHAKG